MANVITIIVLVVILGLAIFRIYKSKKSGGCCGCDCGCGNGNSCSCCGNEPEDPEKPIKIK